MGEQEEKSRAEIIINELECGGFADCELEAIIAAAEKAFVENEQ